jgi:Mn2+/Fe2+ NRAMP family transporter
MWSAAITSVIGASYTTVSFWKTLGPVIHRHERLVISVFILVSACIFIVVGRPVRLLIFAGAVNGIILPVALVVILLIARKSSLMQGYKHSLLLQCIGWIVVAVMTWMSVVTLRQMLF